ncbi:MAG: hypothetical protein KDA61_20130, partial [Planctomycetales bacterium]|nr:hypothetical protein [Planctomycetales bacterium]
VQNHSWIGSFDSSGTPEMPDGDNVRALQKFDYMTDSANGGDGLTAVVGLNNSTGPIPYLLAHGYNAIAVGRSDGIHSSGLTQVQASFAYGPGRSKPDLVAAMPSSSGATSAVSGAAALLYEAVAGTDAENSETVKALLLAGATKDEFLQSETTTWTRTFTQPLDDTFGAGELNVKNSYLIQLGGQYEPTENEPTSNVGMYGWDYQNRKADPNVDDLYYRLEIPTETVANEFSIILTWNHAGALSGGTTYNPAPSLQNLDLALYDDQGSFIAIQSDAALDDALDKSVSTVDNVEHIYVRDDPETSAFEGLLPGVYTLKVSGAAGWDYGLAWRTQTQLAVYNELTETLTPLIDADFDDNGVIDGVDFLIWQQHAGTLVNASRNQGDADGDGDVDADDLLGFNAALGPTPLASVLAIHAVPEPAGLGIALMVSAAAAVRRYRRRQ